MWPAVLSAVHLNEGCSFLSSCRGCLLSSFLFLILPSSKWRKKRKEGKAAPSLVTPMSSCFLSIFPRLRAVNQPLLLSFLLPIFSSIRCSCCLWNPHHIWSSREVQAMFQESWFTGCSPRFHFLLSLPSSSLLMGVSSWVTLVKQGMWNLRRIQTSHLQGFKAQRHQWVCRPSATWHLTYLQPLHPPALSWLSWPSACWTSWPPGTECNDCSQFWIGEGNLWFYVDGYITFISHQLI